MEYNNYLGWIYPKTKDIVSTEDVENIIYLQKGNSGGLATLDGSGKVPTSQLPSYVDDVLEFESKNSFPEEGEEGKIYVDSNSNYTYRWTGNTYVLIGGLQNLVDGNSVGSMRSVSAMQENGNYSLGEDAIAIGNGTQASGNYSHAEGTGTTSSGQNAHALGYYTTATASNAHAEGLSTTASGANAHAEGYRTTASGSLSHAEGNLTKAAGVNSHAEGSYTLTGNNASGAHAEGLGDSLVNSIQANGVGSHAEGLVSGTNASIVASGAGSHAEGYVSFNQQNLASGAGSHVEGSATKATAVYAHAEGNETTASGVASHAEGYQTKASGVYSHALGWNATSSGPYSHALGLDTIASGQNSHVSGIGTTGQRRSQTVIGEYNTLDTTGTTGTRGTYAFIIGNGNSTNARSNALTVAWDGNVLIAGTPTNSNHLATKLYVDTNIIDLESLIQTLGASISSPIVCFTYDITNGQTPSIDFSYADIESAMGQNKIVFIVYKLIVTGDSFTNQNISQTRVTECNVYTTEGTPSYRVYTEDSQMQFIASSETLFMTRASSSQIDPDPADRDPADFS